MHRSRTLVAVLALLITSASTVRAQTATFNDGTFNPADWTVLTQVLNLGGSVAGTQIASGGTSGPYRQIVNTLSSAAGQSFSNSVFGFHQRAGAVFTPGTSGQISSIDYSESSIRLAGGVQACGLALIQSGVVYYGPGFLTPTTFSVWAPTVQTGLTAAMFDDLAPGVHNPDFSVSGAPIQFGFYRSNSTSVGGGGGSTTGGIDDWTVTVHFDAATPARATTWGAVKAGRQGTR